MRRHLATRTDTMRLGTKWVLLRKTYSPTVRQDKVLGRRLVGLGLFGVLLCVFAWGLIATLTAPHLRDRVDLWMFAVAYAVGVVLCLTAFAVTLRSTISRRP
jgi:hypothetical protein